MRLTKTQMGMTVVVEIAESTATVNDLDIVFCYFDYIDRKFSTYKPESEISQINQGKLKRENYSFDMSEVFSLAEKTKRETNGFFDILRNGKIDPSGIVKGWAIHNAAQLLIKNGFKNFFVDAGGDIQVSGKSAQGTPWKIGIKNPFNEKEIVKVISVATEGVATSGTYLRGQHIYNPFNKNKITDIVSLTVIGPNIYEADRFATAAFAMGRDGIAFIGSLPGFEGYLIDKDGQATFTAGFNKYVVNK